MSNDPIAALRHLEQAENILSRADGHTEHRERVSEARMKLASELMQEAYLEAIERADIGDMLLAHESRGTVTYLDGTEVQEE